MSFCNSIGNCKDIGFRILLVACPGSASPLCAVGKRHLHGVLGAQQLGCTPEEILACLPRFKLSASFLATSCAMFSSLDLILPLYGAYRGGPVKVLTAALPLPWRFRSASPPISQSSLACTQSVSGGTSVSERLRAQALHLLLARECACPLFFPSGALGFFFAVCTKVGSRAEQGRVQSLPRSRPTAASVGVYAPVSLAVKQCPGVRVQRCQC